MVGYCTGLLLLVLFAAALVGYAFTVHPLGGAAMVVALGIGIYTGYREREKSRKESEEDTDR